MPQRVARLVRVAIAVAAVLLWSTVWLTDQVIWQKTVQLEYFYAVRLSMLGLVGLVLVIAFVVCVVRPGRLRGVLRCCLVALSVALLGIGLEAVFMFVARSHNVGYTMAANFWFDSFWGSPNSLDYRDVEHVRLPGKKLVFVIGDSFTAGGGLARRADRFPDLAQQRRPDLHVCNLGRNGIDTKGEFEALTVLRQRYRRRGCALRHAHAVLQCIR